MTRPFVIRARMPLAALAVLQLAMLAAPAAACSPGRSERTDTEYGANCSRTVHQRTDQTRASEVTRMSQQLLRQDFRSGNGCLGQELVAYYDCSSGRAVVVVSGYDLMYSYAEEAGPGKSPNIGQVSHFRETVAPELAGLDSLTEIRAKVLELDWMQEIRLQRGKNLFVGGVNFDLSCGCELPETGG